MRYGLWGQIPGWASSGVSKFICESLRREADRLPVIHRIAGHRGLSRTRDAADNDEALSHDKVKRVGIAITCGAAIPRA